MDLESECSALESVEDNEAIAPENLISVEETKIENNGSCAVEHVDDELFFPDNKGKEVEANESVNSPPLAGKSSLSPARKGHGLKKWRRIKREVNKDGGSYVDSRKVLKRGSSKSVVYSMKPPHFSDDMKQKSEASVSSTNATVRNTSVAGEPELVVPPTFAVGTDSENSEDWSSRSSTAASAPKIKYELSAVMGYGRDKYRMRSLSGKNLVNSVQRDQQGKGRIENSKKPRGDRVKIEKDNSHSSMESDSRSSNFVFMQGTNSVTSNGRQSGRSMNYDGENSDEAQGGEPQFSEELQTGYRRKDVGEFGDVSEEDLAEDLSWKVKKDKSENHCSTLDREDPLIESILALQLAQEALEKEVEKLRDIGMEDILDGSSLPSEFASVDPKVDKPSSSDQLQSGESGERSSHSLQTQVISLKQNVDLLENKFEEARAMLKVKEAKVVELEATLNGRKFPKGEAGSTLELQQEKCREVENELESLFRQKIETEIEYLTISRTIQKLRVAAVDQITFIEEQKTLASEQAQMLDKLEYAEEKASMLNRQAKELENCCEDIVGTDEVLKLQNRVCKFTWYFFIQLILLVVVLGLFVLQLSPQYAEVVPT